MTRKRIANLIFIVKRRDTARKEVPALKAAAAGTAYFGLAFFAHAAFARFQDSPAKGAARGIKQV